ncbi:uncharacterized protein LOC142987866 [Anticarsia gemmatalis]|uniref:uncharacterized protein LOC142987866 n=1 Tax=Anticarsia gemmatalis TaxID=129554 RepID=UPI003F774D53
MSVTSGMFIFEVVIEKVNSLVESRHLVIRSDFADVFSLELKDPKTMHIVIPEPPPLPPDPPGKKAKKPPKPKKGKKGAVELPPPEPVIQSGQSVLFSSSAEVLIQNMRKFPMEVSLWSKEDNLQYIGSVTIPWDQMFLSYLQKITECEDAPPVTLNEEYNIFEEGKAKLMAKISLQIKLSYLTDKVTAAFRTLSEDPTIRKCLYTGMNSKTTSYICTMKTTDEDFEENCNKIENQFIVDKPSLKAKSAKVNYADYKNAPGANLTFFNEGDYCCMGHADKPPESIYKAPETCPDVDHIIDYVRKIIVSCNDNMRMLTPRPTIRPRIKATDIDRLCYCKETAWPKGELAERFRKEAQNDPCPICIDAGKKVEGARGATFDIANIRGPCGRADCRIARDMRAYLENLVDEDNIEFDINEVVGPCGSKDCTLADKIQKFLRHEGEFTEGETFEGLSTQCACLQKMQKALTKRESCASICSKDCELTESDASHCGGAACPYAKNNKKVYDVFYFTVEYDFDKKSAASEEVKSDPESGKGTYRYCPPTCPGLKSAERSTCSKTTCSTSTYKDPGANTISECVSPVCPSRDEFPPSPADSKVEISFDDIKNPCCVKSCDVAERVKDFIADSVQKNKAMKSKDLADEDPCYCDCVCTFKFSNKTTYCAVCGGYEALGSDTKDLPDYSRPHPCPVYHKMYDRKYIKTKSPWPEENVPPEQKTPSAKSSKAGSKAAEKAAMARSSRVGITEKDTQGGVKEKAKKAKQEKKQVGKYTANFVEEPAQPPVEKKPEPKYPYPAVPKHMGWNWTAEDIPGLKPRPKWRPGAANKILVRRYRALREGTDTIAKKKRAMLQRKKKIDVKPTLIVTKQDGEYTVVMEVFKKYSKERLLYQYPYDETKAPLTYTIGKTEEEKKKVQQQRERQARRETRRKSRLLQSTFRDKCQEICLKAYNQAIGLLPLPNPNNPECPCFTDDAGPSPPIDSCSCSDEGSISSSDTDNDEWVIEFTPPAALWDAKAKHPPVLTDNESQYNYLDYKVKLFDKNGNPIPRYFKSHEGKQECSDLGGFWGPGKVWLEINKDGYIGPDNRWVPMNFTGPDGMAYSAEEGSFTDNCGQLLKIGVDGYIDKDLKWVWYGRRRGSKSVKSTATVPSKKSPADAQREKAESKTKQVRPPTPPPGKGGQKKPEAKKVTTVAPTKGASGKGKNPLVMSVSVNYELNQLPRFRRDRRNGPYVDPKKMAKYREIMEGLQMYDDIGELKPPVKTNRASNTPRKKVLPFYTRKRMNTLRSYSNMPVTGLIQKGSTSESTHDTPGALYYNKSAG